MAIILSRGTRVILMLIFLCLPVMFIKAQEEENVSSEIVITATKTETKIRDVSGVLEVISADDAKKVNVINVSDLFKTMAGVDLQGGGLPGSEVRLNFRGLTPGYQSKRVLVLVDGRRLNDQYQGNPEMALIPADSIERIEVLKGPASALYGSNAMGGIIISLRNAEPKHPLPLSEAPAGAITPVITAYRTGRKKATWMTLYQPVIFAPMVI